MNSSSRQKSAEAGVFCHLRLGLRHRRRRYCLVLPPERYLQDPWRYGGLPPLPARSLALSMPRPLILQPLDQVGHSLNERSAQWRQQEPLVTTNLGLSRHSGPPKGPRPPGLSTRQGALDGGWDWKQWKVDWIPLGTFCPLSCL